MKSLKVGVITGGNSTGGEVSTKSAAAVGGALRSQGYQVRILELDDPRALVSRLSREHIDAAFLTLGASQGQLAYLSELLDAAGIPFTGSDALGVALASDKVRAKELFRLHNVPTPAFYVSQNVRSSDSDSEHDGFGFPVVVKNRSMGANPEAVLVRSASELTATLRSVERRRGLFVERYVSGREFSVGLLDDAVLGVVEVEPPGELYDRTAQLEGSETRYSSPDLSQAQRAGIHNLAQRAASALGCRGPCRVDLVLADGGNEWVLGVDPQPCLSTHSLFTRLSVQAGFEHAALCEKILRSALRTRELPKPTPIVWAEEVEPVALVG